MDFDEKNRDSLNKKVSPNYFEKPKHAQSASQKIIEITEKEA